MSFYHHHVVGPYFYVPVWVEEYINMWYPQTLKSTEYFPCANCETCVACATTNQNCEMCITCNKKNKLNVKVEPFIPYEIEMMQMEEEFLRANPWVNE